MCSIMGYCGGKVDWAAFQQGFEQTVSRGPDDSRVVDTGKGLLGFHVRPFTKESLLYRDIFEKYYLGQGEMIVDFWMPNKSWAGCDVDDTSARVLSNYGASGC